MTDNKKEQGLLPLATMWLVGLGAFFFVSYGFANWITSLRTDVGSIYFPWERSIPLWSWTIVPYWSLDLMYGVAFLLCKTRLEIRTLGRRLLTLQVLCVSCFLLFPLKFAFDRPPQTGFFGMLFDLLMGFDKPFNQAPSLHVAISVVLWSFYIRYVSKPWRILLTAWFLLIIVSVLTTWQHHFFDIPTGVLAGCFCIWLWPLKQASPLETKVFSKHWRWGLAYLLGAAIVFGVAIAIGGMGLWLCWLAVALLLVAVNYSILGAKGFQKQQDGGYPLATLILYAPYMIIMWLNSRVWTRNNHHADAVLENVYLGRIPSRQVLKQYEFKAVIDLCAELPICTESIDIYCAIPVLDMTLPSAQVLREAAMAIEVANKQGTTLVCCGLGYSRSAAAVVAWLVLTGRVASVDQAIALVRAARPSIVLHQINI